MSTGATAPVPVTVVIATRGRQAELSRTLARLTALEERPQIVVVDNASGDGTPAVVEDGYPAVELVRLPANRGPWARNVGVARAGTRYVAFSDDDSWWEPGSLRLACELLDAHPGLGLVAGRTLVGEGRADDPLNAVLAASPLPRGALPGPRVLGFLGCAAVARRDAYLGVGGYHRLLGTGGEEELLAVDLAAAGWALARRDPAARRALTTLLAALPRALPGRRPLPAVVEAQLRVLERAGR